ncbi:MAG: Tm-1-like ATP-binding domain-containing protein, partial [Armatimonadota bacterium]|nr:Tm-1-like ATP-binding domain-containing protein [Armatimonadota bacterium]
MVILGTLDTKGEECRYLRRAVEALGGRTLLLDVSCLHAAGGSDVDISAERVAAAAGMSFAQVAAMPRREAVEVMGRGAAEILEQLIREGRVAAAIALGGANGSRLAARAVAPLPLGMPKVLVAVVGATDLTALVGPRDITVVNAVCDISLNPITRPILRQAAAAVLKMSTVPRDEPGAAPTVAMSVLGVTQAAAEACRRLLEAGGEEVAAFHANGVGGRALEAAILDGRIARAVELTPSELINHLVGGVFSAGEGRMDAAIARGLPLVVIPGAIDFVNFWTGRVPERFAGRRFLQYTEQNVLMRTSKEEIGAFGVLLAAKLNRVRRPAAVAIPTRGFSRFDHADGPEARTLRGEAAGPWFDPEADAVFGQALEGGLRTDLVRAV